MTVYYIGTGKKNLRHAGGKAPNDVYTLCERRNWRELRYPLLKSWKDDRLHRTARALLVARFWVHALFLLRPGDVVFYQHPVRFGSKVAFRFLKKLKQRQVRFVALVHDLDSLRARLLYTPEDKTNVFFEDGPFLKQFDVIICHNARMKRYLTEQGFPEDRLVCLELFDYLQPSSARLREEGGNALVVAGNFDRKKCVYLYELIQQSTIPLNLYGINYAQPPSVEETVRYFGSFDPDELPAVIQGQYGVVWDGESIETCAGATGEYLRYNNPHKLSLYIAAGLPVIIWDEAAAADLVRKYGVGIAVRSLCGLDDLLAKVPAGEYRRMRENVLRLRERVIQGAFFDRAINVAFEKLGSASEAGKGEENHGTGYGSA